MGCGFGPRKARNLKVESLFGRMCCHQRRISGRKSTQPLRDFGHYQIRFMAQSEEQLLEQLRQVPVKDYQAQRKFQANAESPRKFLARLHRDPAKIMQQLAEKYVALQSDLAKLPVPIPVYTG